jgi:hypothetical protein
VEASAPLFTAFHKHHERIRWNNRPALFHSQTKTQ